MLEIPSRKSVCGSLTSTLSKMDWTEVHEQLGGSRDYQWAAKHFTLQSHAQFGSRNGNITILWLSGGLCVSALWVSHRTGCQLRHEHIREVKDWEKRGLQLFADGVPTSERDSDMKRGVQLFATLLVYCEIEGSSSLELVMDFTFYKDMIKLVMYAGKKMYGQGFKL